MGRPPPEVETGGDQDLQNAAGLPCNQGRGIAAGVWQAIPL